MRTVLFILFCLLAIFQACSQTKAPSQPAPTNQPYSLNDFLVDFDAYQKHPPNHAEPQTAFACKTPTDRALARAHAAEIVRSIPEVRAELETSATKLLVRPDELPVIIEEDCFWMIGIYEGNKKNAISSGFFFVDVVDHHVIVLQATTGKFLKLEEWQKLPSDQK